MSKQDDINKLMRNKLEYEVAKGFPAKFMEPIVYELDIIKSKINELGVEMVGNCFDSPIFTEIQDRIYILRNTLRSSYED